MDKKSITQQERTARLNHMTMCHDQILSNLHLFASSESDSGAFIDIQKHKKVEFDDVNKRLLLCSEFVLRSKDGLNLSVSVKNLSVSLKSQSKGSFLTPQKVARSIQLFQKTTTPLREELVEGPTAECLQKDLEQSLNGLGVETRCYLGLINSSIENLIQWCQSEGKANEQ